MLSAR
jgi:vacuole morphology and inheritance protein 14